jgi:hypothetical protein
MGTRKKRGDNLVARGDPDECRMTRLEGPIARDQCSRDRLRPGTAQTHHADAAASGGRGHCHDGVSSRKQDDS